MDTLGGISGILAVAHPPKTQLGGERVWFTSADDRILVKKEECEVAP